MAQLDARPARLDINAAAGDDVAITLTTTTTTWLDGETLSAPVTTLAGASTGVSFTASWNAGTLSLSLTDTDTGTTLGAGRYRWRLTGTESGVTTTHIAGNLILAAQSDGTGTTSGSYTVNVTSSSVTLSVNATALGQITEHLADTVDAHDASAISVLDSAGYYSATDVEGVLAEGALQRLRDLTRPFTVAQIKVMSSPPTIGALATSSAIASSVTHFTSSGPDNNINTAFFTTCVGSDWARFGNTFPNHNFISQTSPTVGAGSSYGRLEFDYYGSALEINGKGSQGVIRIWVDGELVSTTPTIFTNTGSQYYLPVTFSTTAHRRITIDHYNFAFGGVTIGPNDTITPVDVRRPKVLLLGDSFVEGAGASNCDGFVPVLAASLGWDVWASGQGGSGYSAPGSYTGKYSTRISQYSAMDFDVIITSGGINDANATYISSLAADAASLFTTIKSTWPTAVWICTSPLINKGVEGWTSQYHTARKTLESAASAAGFYYVDLMSMPIVGSTATSGTLSSTASSGATTISSSVRVPIRATIEIGTGLSTVERRVVTATTGSGPYTLTVAALSSTHTAGEVVTQVGNCLWTGTGRVGATTGSGNCDLYVSSDSTHPTQAGHLAIGRTIAALISSALNPY